MKKIASDFGVKLGLGFCIGSIFLTFTMIGPLFILMLTESLGQVVNHLLGIDHLGKATFGLCLFVLILVLSLYLISFKKWSHSSQNSLLFFFFLTILIFFNSLLFYVDFIKPNFRMDGQQSFNIIFMPLKTCWIYIIIGAFHFSLREKLKRSPN